MADSVLTGAAAAPHAERWLLIGVVSLAAVLRLPGLDSRPPPLNQDEASRAYDAWCLSETGRDRWGQPWPLFLRSFGPGDYTAALSTYLIVPIVGLLGPGTVAARLPNALLGVATVAGAWLVARRLFGARIALVAALLLSLNPWHISMTRTAHESALGPFLLTFGFLGLLWARLPPFHEIRNDLDEPNTRSSTRPVASAILAGIMFALGAWVYPAPRLLIPVLLAAAVLLFPRAWQRCLRDREHRLAIAAFIAALAAASAPIWWTWRHHPERLAARARSVVVFYEPTSLTDQLAAFATNYAKEFHPFTLFVGSDDIAMWGAMGQTTPYGRLLHIEAPLILAGLIVLLRRARRHSTERWLLIWLLLHPLPAAVCNDWNPNPLRAQQAIPLWSIISAIGALSLWRILTQHWSRAMRPMAVAAALALAADAGWFAYAYTVRHPIETADHFQENLVRAMQYAGDHLDEYDFVWVSDIHNQPYIYTLLFAPVSPEVLSDLPVVVTPWYQRFEHVVRVGKFLYAPLVQPQTPIGREALATFRRELFSIPPGSRGLIIDVPGRGPPGELVKMFPLRNGEPGLELRAGTLQHPGS